MCDHIVHTRLFCCVKLLAYYVCAYDAVICPACHCHVMPIFSSDVFDLFSLSSYFNDIIAFKTYIFIFLIKKNCFDKTFLLLTVHTSTHEDG